jgi:hypothetical protein
MADATQPNFSVMQKDGRWFWCSLSLGGKNELMSLGENEWIGPFPSQEEAEKDARATLKLF